MAEVALVADVRSDLGSSNSRRLRTSGRIPAVVYGHGIEPKSVSVNARELRLALNTDAGVNALLSLDIAGEKHLALTRDIQRHPVRGTVAHVDFLVVNRNETITADIPITFIGEALKVTKNGGMVEHLLNSLAISATPSTLPSHIEIDLSDLELEGSIRVSDIKLPKGVTATIDGDEPVAVGKLTRAAAGEDEEAAAAEGATAEGAAPAAEG
jgi:large subunit ribosomal protein L25